ncbi:hypothetical protein MIMGU_mgv1a019631mg, partial [Erythranthe guttata]
DFSFALHLAAKAGNESTVKTLVSQSQDVAGGGNNNLLRAKNVRGNIALHETLINGRDSIALYWIEKDPEVSYYENKEGESALYLAAKAGSAECVDRTQRRVRTTPCTYTSIVVAVTLIWAQLGDIKLALNALTFAVPLLGIALCMMSIVFLVVSKLRWLSTAVLVMAIVFLVIMFIILVPMCGSHTSSNRIVRYLSYYPFYLLILASSS